ncbi:unnamed protein product [Durusdinium trenchii]|uniref:SnoaL-like domain-containing protein n=1 Tax=Durusdinium trenchii TaxID=1381693 RepID=A0ABP0NVB0_9DINO
MHASSSSFPSAVSSVLWTDARPPTVGQRRSSLTNSAKPATLRTLRPATARGAVGTTALLVGLASRAVARRTAAKARTFAVLPRIEGLHPVVHEELVLDPPRAPPPELGAVVRQLYASFNQCDADRTAACFTEDVVYEDLLLGNSTIVQSRAEFLELIRTHPVFVSARACGMLGLPPLDIKVEVSGQPLVLGRGLSFMKICRKTGLIAKATDIAEAPWRAIGLVLSPFARGIRDVSRLLRDWSFSSAITVVLFAVLFLDRSSLDMLRDDIDTLDDFRNRLEQLPEHQDLKAYLAEMVAKSGGST